MLFNASNVFVVIVVNTKAHFSFIFFAHLVHWNETKKKRRAEWAEKSNNALLSVGSYWDANSIGQAWFVLTCNVLCYICLCTTDFLQIHYFVHSASSLPFASSQSVFEHATLYQEFVLFLNGQICICCRVFCTVFQ